MNNNSSTLVQSLGTILGVWAHPDDEVFSCGGIMAIARENGQRVMCASATKGEAGVQDESRWPASKLAEIREHELDVAYEHLGLTEHCWYGYPDGKLSEIDESEGIAAVLDCIEQCRPDSILTFGPDGMTGHPDHQTISTWATAAARQRGIDVYHVVVTPQTYANYQPAHDKFNVFFNIDRPPIVEPENCAIFVQLPMQALNKKCAALKAMESQTERMVKFLGDDNLQKMLAEESFVRG